VHKKKGLRVYNLQSGNSIANVRITFKEISFYFEMTDLDLIFDVGKCKGIHEKW